MESGELAALVGALGVAGGAILTALLKRSAQQHAQDAADITNVIAKWREIVDRIEADNAVATQRLEGRLTSLELSRDSCVKELYQTKIEHAATKQRMASLEAQLHHIESGTGTAGPIAVPALVVADETGTITDVNTATTDLLGWTREDLVGQNIEKMMPERYKELHRKALSARTSNTTTFDSTRTLGTEALTKSGKEIPVNIRLTMRQSEPGKSTFSAAITRRT